MLVELSMKVLARPDADERESAELARQLRHELLGLSEVEDVQSRLTSAGPRAKSPLGSIDWQTLIVTLAASGGVLTTLISAAQAVLAKRPQATLKIKLGEDEVEITGDPSDQERQLIHQWLQRHKAVVK